MKIIRYSLQFMGGWPSRLLGENVSKFEHIHILHLSVLSVICLPSMLLYLKRNIGVIDFLDLGFSYITCSLNLFATVSTYRRMYDFIIKQYYKSSMCTIIFKYVVICLSFDSLWYSVKFTEILWSTLFIKYTCFIKRNGLSMRCR